MNEEIEPTYHDGLWIPEEQKKKDFESLHIDKFLNNFYGDVPPTTARVDLPTID